MNGGRLTEAQIEMLRRADEIYYPCYCGVHVCGDRGGMAATLGNIPTRTEQEARVVFAACKAEAEALIDEPQDFVVDLNIHRDNLHIEDFSMTRQMLERCLAAGRLALSQERNDER